MTDSTAFAAPPLQAAPSAPTVRAQKGDIAAVPRAPWETLCATCIEPNVFFDPGFAVPATGQASGGKGADALVAFEGEAMIGLLPVVSAWQALKLPIPALIALQPYSPLSTPLLDKTRAIAAAGALIDGAANAGAHLLVLPDMALHGPCAAAINAALAQRGLVALTAHAHQRAAFDAETGDVDAYLRAGMGAKKLKEMRRLRNRLADDGALALNIADNRATIPAALDRFLDLEARGWKGARGTGLGQSESDKSFIHAVAADMGARHGFEIVELTLNAVTIATGLVLRHGARAFFFKIAYDETLARYSPGVQLTLELTRRFADDPTLALVDSTAAAGHPMIDHVWRERLAIGDLLVPTRPGNPVGPALARLVMARQQARETAKHFAHFIASIGEKKP